MTTLNKKLFFRPLMLAASIGFILSGCGGEDDTASETPPVVNTSTSQISARIFDGATGQPLTNARFSVGGVSAITNAQGDIQLAGIPISSNALVTVTAAGYANQVVLINLNTREPLNRLNVQLTPIIQAGQVNVSTGGVVSLPNSSAQVTIAPNTLRRLDGQPIVGAVSVAIGLINTAQDIRQMPGDLATLVNGVRQPLESFGAMTVTLTDASNSAVGLISGQTAAIRIPVAARGATPATIPLYYFDSSRGLWQVDGSLTLSEQNGDSFYTGVSSTLNTVNADIPYQPVQVTGCVEDNQGRRVANAEVFLEGINYSGYSLVSTNANGEFSASARPNSSVIVSSQYRQLVSNSVDLSVTNSNTNIGSGCLSLATAESNVRVRLTWGAQPEDLDSHVVTPDGTRVYYAAQGQLTGSPFTALDVDDTTGFGPEVMTLRRLMVGKYHYMVHNYSETANPAITGSSARVELTTSTGIQNFTPMTSGETASTFYWHVFDLNVDAQCRITVTPISQWRTEAQALSILDKPATTPVFCVPVTP